MEDSRIIYVDGSDVLVYSSIEHAESDIEPLDLAGDIIKVYDIAGNRMKLFVTEYEAERKILCFKSTLKFKKVNIVYPEVQDNRRNELREALINSVRVMKKNL